MYYSKNTIELEPHHITSIIALDNPLNIFKNLVALAIKMLGHADTEMSPWKLDKYLPETLKG